MSRWIIPLVAALLSVIAEEGTAQQILLNEALDGHMPEVPMSASARVANSSVPRMDWAVTTLNEATESTQDVPILLPLRPLSPQGAQAEGHRVQGQFAEARFSLFLPDGAEGAELALTTLSSINVLPEQSNIRVDVNGTSIGTVIPDNFDQAQTDVLTIPDGALKAGRNIVTLQIQQVHRVFCGPDAAFDLWTDVVLSQSGVEMQPEAIGADPAGFMSAAAAQLSRGQPLTVVDAQGAADFETTSAALARVESVFGGLPPEIEITGPYQVAPEQPALARVTLIAEDQAPAGLPQFRRGGDGALVLLGDAAHPEEVAELLLSAFSDSQTAPAVPMLTPGATRSLADLGVSRLAGRGHYIRETVRFGLPWDWLVLSADRAELRLDYGFDRNLPEGALLLVKINDRTVHLLPLDENDKAGQRVETLRVPFAANLLEPGANQLTFEALVPGDPPDEACVPRTTPIFEIFDTTTLNIPAAPSMSISRLDHVLAALKPEAVTMSDAARDALPLGLLPRLASAFAGANGHALRAGGRAVSLTIGVPSDLSVLGGDILGDNASKLQEAMLIAPKSVERDIDTWARVDKRRWWHVFAVKDLRDKLAAIWRGPRSELDAWLEGRAADAVLLQPDLDKPEQIWLILRPALSPDKLVASLIGAEAPLRAPDGQVSLFSPDDGWQSWESSDRSLQLHEPLTLGNARQVAGNYASMAPPVFIIPMLLLSLVSALLAMGFMIVTRRRKT